MLKKKRKKRPRKLFQDNMNTPTSVKKTFQVHIQMQSHPKKVNQSEKEISYVTHQHTTTHQRTDKVTDMLKTIFRHNIVTKA